MEAVRGEGNQDQSANVRHAGPKRMNECPNGKRLDKDLRVFFWKKKSERTHTTAGNVKKIMQVLVDCR